MSLPPGVILQGIVLGSLTGLSAMGLVLVYRACRIVNFAQATLGSAAGVLATQLFQHRGWNYYAAHARSAFHTKPGRSITLNGGRRFRGASYPEQAPPAPIPPPAAP